MNELALFPGAGKMLRRASRRWRFSRDGDAWALDLLRRHYSFRNYRDGRRRTLFVGPGEKMVLVTERLNAVFVWRKFISADGQTGVNCAAFRNESRMLSSRLVGEAMAVAWRRWPGERLYTYVNARKVRSRNPGYCFLRAGWSRCGATKRGLLIFEATPEGRSCE